MKRTIVLASSLQRQRAQQAIADAPAGFVVKIHEPTRNLEQNAALWVLLDAFAAQLRWPINGVMTRIDAMDWKDLLTAAFRRERTRVAQGIDGGIVMLGSRTSQMGKREFSEFLEFIHSVADDRGVDL